MSSQQQQQAKKKGGWGSLLSGAVSGLESRLDSILAEENALAAQKAADSVKKGSSASTSNNVSRTPSTRRSRPPGPPARSQTPQPAPTKAVAPRASTDSTASDSAVISATATTEQPRASQESGSRPSHDIPQDTPRTSTDQRSTSLDVARITSNEAAETNGHVEKAHVAPVKNVEELDSELQQVRSDYENVELRRQEEVHDYMERIDALQAKLHYLSKEASEAARKAVTEAGKDALERKVAEKDEKIALLLEEGTKLSKSEVTQLGTIRNLRAEKTEQASSLANLKRKLGLQDSVLKDQAFEVLRLEVERREALNRASRVASLENEVASLKSTVANKDERIRKLEEDVQAANARADDETRQRNAEALDIERATSSSLRDEVTKLKNDLASHKDQSKTDTSRAQEQQKAAQERHQATEAALKNEITALEGRLEIMRSKTEETTTNTTSESSTKLMRQVEVLQRQYSVASENWQGIEASMQSRITALEKERDESTKHENEARRKMREAGSSSRKLQDQLDDASQRIRVFEHEVAEHKANADSVQKKANEFQKQLQEAKDKFEREKQNLTLGHNAKLEEERNKWQSQLHGAESLFAGSPQLSNPRRSSTLDLPGLGTRRADRRSTQGLTLSSIHRDPNSRRSSALPPTRGSEHLFSPSSESGPPTPFFGNAGNVPPTPSLPTVTTERDPDDDFENNSSPRRTINDMVSASTAAAGPSVQLVERMSASVRRLETEKAANKEELVRLSGQRDEARKEIVNLMQEVEVKRDIDKKAEKLEKDLADTQRRYAASLEMLGEKEEKVSELQADVADLKKIYRELVERTVK